jgi:hypothetical protein
MKVKKEIHQILEILIHLIKMSVIPFLMVFFVFYLVISVFIFGSMEITEWFSPNTRRIIYSMNSNRIGKYQMTILSKFNYLECITKYTREECDSKLSVFEQECYKNRNYLYEIPARKDVFICYQSTKISDSWF